MSVLFPIGINNKKEDKNNVTWLFVNPETITIKKNPSISEMRTMGGNVFQPWINKPDEISFSGIFYGWRSYLFEIDTLTKSLYETPGNKEIGLIYKFKEYKGFIVSFSMSKNAIEGPRFIKYDLTFKSKDVINLKDMMLGSLTDPRVDLNYMTSDFSINQFKTGDDANWEYISNAAFATYRIFTTDFEYLKGYLKNLGFIIGAGLLKSYNKKNSLVLIKKYKL